MEDKRWYAVKVHSGFEAPVVNAINQATSVSSVAGKIGEIFIPIEKQVYLKNGKRVEKEVKVFPGHILVHMVLDEDTQSAINNIEYVSGFLGSRTQPEPLPDEQIVTMKQKLESNQSTAPKAEVEVGAPVRITEGPFENLDGRVSEVDPARGEVTVLVSMFGRDTPVKLELFQIKQL